MILFTPIWIGLLGVLAGAIVVATYHFITIGCCNPRRRLIPTNRRQGSAETNQENMPCSPSNSTTHLIPIFRYSKGCQEETCAVCLCEFKEGEEVRVLPECLHLFHVACIDMWLDSHSNCPPCRADTSPPITEVFCIPNPGGIPLPDRQPAQQVAGF